MHGKFQILNQNIITKKPNVATFLGLSKDVRFEKNSKSVKQFKQNRDRTHWMKDTKSDKKNAATTTHWQEIQMLWRVSLFKRIFNIRVKSAQNFEISLEVIGVQVVYYKSTEKSNPLR